MNEFGALKDVPHSMSSGGWRPVRSVATEGCNIRGEQTERKRQNLRILHTGLGIRRGRRRSCLGRMATRLTARRGLVDDLGLENLCCLLAAVLLLPRPLSHYSAALSDAYDGCHGEGVTW